jgi:hypothetical protein
MVLTQVSRLIVRVMPTIAGAWGQLGVDANPASLWLPLLLAQDGCVLIPTGHAPRVLIFASASTMGVVGAS